MALNVPEGDGEEGEGELLDGEGEGEVLEARVRPNLRALPPPVRADLRALPQPVCAATTPQKLEAPEPWLAPLSRVPVVKSPPSTAAGAPDTAAAATQATAAARARLKMKLARKESWMPLVQRVVMQGGYATNAVWGCDRQNFIAVGGANGMILLRDYPSMSLLNGFICESSVNAVGGSQDGSLLAYGLRNGNVELRDVRHLRSSQDKTIERVQTLRHDGKVCAVWVSPDTKHIVVAWNGFVTVWKNAAGQTTSGGAERETAPVAAAWERMAEWEKGDMNSRFMGQHALSGAESDHAWGKDVATGDFLVAIGGVNDVSLVAVKTGKVVLHLPAEGGGRCNAVWLSDGCHLLAAAGSTRSICVWGLPEVDLMHRFPAPNRVWALWGNDRILASAGSDSMVTVRCIQTGSTLFVLHQDATVYSIWGKSDGSYLTSSGRGSILTRCLKPLRVCSQLALDRWKDDSWTEAMWSDGIVIAWGGQKGCVRVCGIQSGEVLMEFVVAEDAPESERHVIKSLWGFCLEGDYAIAAASGSTVVVRSLLSGRVLSQITAPGRVLALGGRMVSTAPPSTGSAAAMGPRDSAILTSHLSSSSSPDGEGVEEGSVSGLGVLGRGVSCFDLVVAGKFEEMLCYRIEQVHASQGCGGSGEEGARGPEKRGGDGFDAISEAPEAPTSAEACLGVLCVL